MHINSLILGEIMKLPMASVTDIATVLQELFAKLQMASYQNSYSAELVVPRKYLEPTWNNKKDSSQACSAEYLLSTAISYIQLG